MSKEDNKHFGIIELLLVVALFFSAVVVMEIIYDFKTKKAFEELEEKYGVNVDDNFNNGYIETGPTIQKRKKE